MKIKSSACSRTKISEIKTYLALWTQKKIKLVNSKIAQQEISKVVKKLNKNMKRTKYKKLVRRPDL